MRTPHWADDPTSADDYSRMVDDAADEARDRAYLADDGVRDPFMVGEPETFDEVMASVPDMTSIDRRYHADQARNYKEARRGSQ